MQLSIIIPVYNELVYIEQVLKRVAAVLPEVSKEIIVVDDGSTDGTREWLQATYGLATAPIGVAAARVAGGQSVLVGADYSPATSVAAWSGNSTSSVRVILHEHNQGKGAALRTGLAAATGDVLVIQDADLEYDPRDWVEMWELMADGHADVVYGSRFYGKPHRVLYYHHYVGNRLISRIINLVCDVTLTDVETCYKMFRREVMEGIQLTCNDFGFEVEFTMKVARQKRWRIYEMGIRYYGRTYAEGKKINWKDGVKALAYIARFSFQR